MPIIRVGIKRRFNLHDWKKFSQKFRSKLEINGRWEFLPDWIIFFCLTKYFFAWLKSSVRQAVEPRIGTPEQEFLWPFHIFMWPFMGSLMVTSNSSTTSHENRTHQKLFQRMGFTDQMVGFAPWEPWKVKKNAKLSDFDS